MKMGLAFTWRPNQSPRRGHPRLIAALLLEPHDLLKGLPGELGEIVRDLTEITRAGVDSTDGEEANESALAELTEFVRVGVQLVFDELEPLRERHIPPGHVLH